ncbi:hypothetical protein CHU98_g2315 [Xylaria longipes]|nr:hypothetical protein CHU98_g2315 [Xylaria longipes]
MSPFASDFSGAMDPRAGAVHPRFRDGSSLVGLQIHSALGVTSIDTPQHAEIYPFQAGQHGTGIIGHKGHSHSNYADRERDRGFKGKVGGGGGNDLGTTVHHGGMQGKDLGVGREIKDGTEVEMDIGKYVKSERYQSRMSRD